MYIQVPQGIGVVIFTFLLGAIKDRWEKSVKVIYTREPKICIYFG